MMEDYERLKAQKEKMLKKQNKKCGKKWFFVGLLTGIVVGFFGMLAVISSITW